MVYSLDTYRPLNYHKLTGFEWDTDKNELCYTQRGFDFAYVLPAFFDPNKLIVEDTRKEYGERRYQLMGCVDQRIYTVIYTLRGQTVRIISAHKANRREVNKYEKNTGQH